MSRNANKRQAPRRLRPRPPAGPRPLEFDQVAAEKVARFLTTIFVGGVDAPLVEPVAAWVDHAGFDRALCLAGCRMFVRKRRHDDWPEGLGPVVGGHVLVEEVIPGVRKRRPLMVARDFEMN